MQNVTIGYSESTTYKKQGSEWLYIVILNIFVKTNRLVWLFAPNVTGKSGERKGCAQGFEFIVEVLQRWPEGFYVCPEEDCYVM